MPEIPRAVYQNTLAFAQVDGSLDALASVEVSVFSATDVLADIFPDWATALPMDNPLTTDVDGVVEFYAEVGEYTILVHDTLSRVADHTIKWEALNAAEQGIPTRMIARDGLLDVGALLPGGLDLSVLADEVLRKLVPAGSLLASVAAAAPTGYLLCDGGPPEGYLRATYPDLFTALGGGSSPYGLPDGTHFKVPDLRGRVPVGVDGTAGRLDALDALGNVGGAQKHALVPAELPYHRHGMSNVAFADSGVFDGVLNVDDVAGDGIVAPIRNNLTENQYDIYNVITTDQPHNNMQPYQVVNWLIKT